MGLQFLFMDDNAPCHRTVAAEQLLESRRLAARTLPPVTIRELRLALQDEWAAMPQQLIDTLILSMGRRCETCLAIRPPKGSALGRSCATTSADDRYLTLRAQRNRIATLSKSDHLSLSASSGRLVSRSIMCRRLHERDLYAIRPAIWVFIHVTP
ncbi:hypothetical protein TNCV_4282311 [Trichonephila clavipes]|nr:hypothetical protein TNCV_4282311 [Trichonephila clavipes]